MKMILVESGEDCLFKLVFIPLLFISFNLFAQEQEISEGDIMAKVNQAMEAGLSDFLDKMSEVDELSQAYIQKRQDQCLGDFSSFIINEKGEKVLKKKKLTKSERNQCLLMVIEFRSKMTRLMFKARKKYLKDLHASQEKELGEMEAKSLKELESLAKKYQK